MPELPEVEIVCQRLAKELIGKTIIDTTYFRSNLRKTLPSDLNLIHHHTINAIKRRAKYIQIFFSSDYVMLIHLGMTGKLFFVDLTYDLNKHDHVVFSISDGRRLIYQDIRRFGLIDLCPTSKLNTNPLLVNMGIEPLTPQFDYLYLKQKLNNKSLPIKPALMDNKIVVGVGNIYACESLFRSKISPIRKANSLSTQELELLITNIKHILEEAIKAGGSSVKNYTRPDNSSGSFQLQLQVYGRDGELCKICQQKIFRCKQVGRSTFYCKSCQI